MNALIYQVDSKDNSVNSGHQRAHLGEMLYRGATIGAAVVAMAVVIGVLLNIGHENGAAIVRTLTIASIAWGLGRTALHFFAGR